MTKVLKFVGRFIGISLEWLLIFLISFAFLIRTKTVQTYVAQKAAAFFSGEWNTTVQIEGVEFVFYDRLSINGVKVLDQQGKTMLNTERILVTLDKLDLTNSVFSIAKAELENGEAWVYKNKQKGEFNFQFIVDYFASDSPPTKSKPFTLQIAGVSMANFHLRYDDFQKEAKAFGLDYDHVDLKNFNIDASEFELNGPDIKLALNDLRFEEKSGFISRQFQAKVALGPKGILIDNLKVKTPNSRIFCSKVHLTYESWGAFGDFEDSVNFDIALLPSSVSLKDVSFFADALEGMDDVVTLSANVSNPLKNMQIKQLNLRVGKQTYLNGNIDLPDFRKGNADDYKAFLSRGYIALSDIEKLHLPIGNKPLKFEGPVSRLAFCDLKNFRFSGNPETMRVKADSLKTAVGTVSLCQFIQLKNEAKAFSFAPNSLDSSAITLHQVQLGKLIANDALGVVSGKANLTGKFSSNGDMALEHLKASLNRFDYNGYAYSNIELEEGTLINEELDAVLKIKDPNIELNYDGKINFGKQQAYSVDLELAFANLGKLNFTNEQDVRLSTSIVTDLHGTSFDDISGTIQANFLQYQENGDELNIPVLNLIVSHTKEWDQMDLKSSILNASIQGKIDYATVVDDFIEDLAKVMPSLIVSNRDPKTKRASSDLKFEVTTGVLDEFLTIFVPGLEIEKNTRLSGSYQSATNNMKVDLISGFVKYEDFKLEDLNFTQRIDKEGIFAEYNVNDFKYGDSLRFDKIKFETTGNRGQLNSRLSWNPETKDFSEIEWNTVIAGVDHLNFTLNPSFFSLNGMRWEIANESDIMLTEKDLHVTNFKLKRDLQSIRIFGCVSQNDYDLLTVKASHFDLGELSQLLGLDIKIEGLLTSNINLKTLYTNMDFNGDVFVDNLKLNNEEVGRIHAQTDWNAKRESVNLEGDLEYLGAKSFDFKGLYDVNTEKIDLNLLFKGTDIRFANAFMDPEVVKEIGGKLNGSIRVSGLASKPKLKGRLDLSDGTAKVEMLGVRYRMSGPIQVEEDAFYLNANPVADEEGNTGSLVGSITHHDFDKWNMDLMFDFEDDYGKKPLRSGKRVPLEKFMVLNTSYKEGDLYFGKAYARGTANISGSLNNLDVTVAVQTKKGTLINFPMYGVSEIEENADFVEFVQKGIVKKVEEQKVDFTGINLDMTFDVNPDAQMMIIFNEQIHDEISASGKGKINMRLDQFNHVTLNGDYVIGQNSAGVNSVYNFAMGPIKQPFTIEDGSKISWTGDPLNANIDIKTKVSMNNVSILELSPEQADKTLSSQNVDCYLNLTESLLNPKITFDIKAPKAPETGKTLISRVTGDPDELNKQFFSLLLIRKFQPLKGSVTAGGSAALDLVESQINAALNGLSEKYKLNVDMKSDDVSKDSKYGVGLKTGFLDDRLIVSGSFGVENKSATDATSGTSSKSTNSLIGDVSVEYLVNEKGTFRINAFNKSNNNSVKENQGPFTQGAGISYHEDFNKFEDFELMQFFLDIFRKKANRKTKRTQKHLTDVPDLPKSEKTEKKKEPLKKEKDKFDKE